MVEQTNLSEHTFVKAEHQNGGKTRQIRIEDVSYDKDVVEINLPDAVVSSNYGGNFVKDVCIDDGVLTNKKASAEKVESKKVCPTFDSSVGDANADLKEDIRVDPLKTAQKTEIVTLHVARATDGNTMEEIRVNPVKTSEVHDLEGNKTTDESTDTNVENLSPRQLSSHEAAEQCQQKTVVIPETCETHKPFCVGEAIDEV
jgi:hypothetical protein